MINMDERINNMLENSEISNPGEIHAPVIVLVDLSGSMEIAMDELRKGLSLFKKCVLEDEIASGRVDVSLIGFSDSPRQLTPFSLARNMEIPNIESGGCTAMHQAVGLALDALEQRKAQYRAAGVSYKRGFIFLLSDGMPTDSDSGEFARLMESQKNNHCIFWGVAIGPSSDKALLKSLNTKGLCMTASKTEFSQAFVWLSNSISSHSQAMPGEPTVLDNPNTEPEKYLGQITIE